MLFAAAAKHSSPVIIIIYFVFFGGLYFFYLRPRNRKMKAARQQGSSFDVGDRVHTIGGLIGTVVEKTEHAVTLRTDSGHELHFIPSAIAKRIDSPVAPTSTDEQGTTN
jgi:preprotein translocase YajC subunit